MKTIDVTVVKSNRSLGWKI